MENNGNAQACSFSLVSNFGSITRSTENLKIFCHFWIQAKLSKVWPFDNQPEVGIYILPTFILFVKGMKIKNSKLLNVDYENDSKPQSQGVQKSNFIVLFSL